jgi:hypothetical protein
MAWPRSRRVRRTGPGRYAVQLSPDEQALVIDLTEELRAVLEAGTDDPSVRRLFPTAYHDDAERDREYQLLARDELLTRRLAALELMATTASARELDAAGLTAWMASVNDLRLVIGTNLDVSEDDGPIEADEPDAQARAIYGYLTGLLDDIVSALTDGLSDADPQAERPI